eukprot:scaffold18806_cov33-Prasinocladus_malaysianus.AAC.1
MAAENVPRLRCRCFDRSSVVGGATRIELARGGVKVTDLKSTNGTLINGREIRSALLKPGQTLEIGSAEFILERK